MQIILCLSSTVFGELFNVEFERIVHNISDFLITGEPFDENE